MFWFPPSTCELVRVSTHRFHLSRHLGSALNESLTLGQIKVEEHVDSQCAKLGHGGVVQSDASLTVEGGETARDVERSRTVVSVADVMVSKLLATDAAKVEPFLSSPLSGTQ
jgi:hypothetical protein